MPQDMPFPGNRFQQLQTQVEMHENVDLLLKPEVEQSTSGTPFQSVPGSSMFQELGITDQQFKAIKLTLAGKNDTFISANLDVGRTTLWRWKTHDPAYRAVLSGYRRQIRESFGDRCINELATAINVIETLMESSHDDQIRLRAAEILLRHGHKYAHPPENSPDQKLFHNSRAGRPEDAPAQSRNET